MDPELRGFWIQDRLAAVFCANDLHGPWVRDPLGKDVYDCEPGGETQRREAFKLMINVIIYSLTGSYKTDAVHQPFLEKKLKK